MTGRVSAIWRYPIKSHGRETLVRVTLEPGKALPWDRVWAVAHTESKADGTDWASCANFSRAAKAPGLAAISSRLDEATGRVTLRHPDLGELEFHPDDEPERLIAWAGGLVPANRSPSHRVVRARAQNFTDSAFPSVTLCNAASHKAVEERLGADLSPQRWRGNIWIEGLAPWAEFDWIGREVTVGGATLRVEERTDRCLATHANPDTGARDADILAALDSFGHQDFSVRAVVTEGGDVALGDAVTPS
ncbi:MOSC domain-containing protein [Roseovarius aestuariivivens]|uniref:MOSC domain-containing protein n=1 Tax=Roseovarius aestuariivivens TaxID=1888910 RepID=UPI001080851E|nr:MOSC N-terminal beta barrel domain-containing protein [Roseovarius aestuariivivens]